MSDYISIPCIEHERLEFAVLRRQRLLLLVRDASGNTRTLTVLPIDMTTRDQAEWLTYREDSGAVAVVRLDHILSATPV